MSANLRPRSETLRTEVKILTGGAGDSQAIEFVRAVVALIPEHNKRKVNTKLRVSYTINRLTW